MDEEQPHDTLQKQGQRLKFSSWVRPGIIIITIIFFCVSAITWIWKIWGDWSGIMSAIFTISGAVSAFFAIPFFYSSDRSKTSADLHYSRTC
jgi:polyferredoxin